MLQIFRNIFIYPFFKWFNYGIGVVLAVVLIGNDFFDLSVFTSVLLGLSLYSVFIIFRFFYWVFEFFSNATYANVITRSKNAIAEINSNKRLKRNDKEEIMEDVTTMCNLLQVVFERKTGSNCSVSLKVPILPCSISKDSELKDLCIDYKHQSLMGTNEYRKLKHTVIGNTAFQVAVSNVLYYKVPFYYLNNNIPKTRNYHSTSRFAYPDQKLPFKSELVYPIIPLPDQPAYMESEKVQIWGFLCIESGRKNSFRNRYDVALVAGVADRMLNVLMKIKKLETEKLA